MNQKALICFIMWLPTTIARAPIAHISITASNCILPACFQIVVLIIPEPLMAQVSICIPVNPITTTCLASIRWNCQRHNPHFRLRSSHVNINLSHNQSFLPVVSVWLCSFACLANICTVWHGTPLICCSVPLPDIAAMHFKHTLAASHVLHSAGQSSCSS